MSWGTIALQMATVAFATAGILLALSVVTPGNFLTNNVRDTSPGQPVRQLGGLVIVPVAMVAAFLFGSPDTRFAPYLPAVGAIIAIWFLGLFDDRYHLPARPKLAVQLIAAFAAATTVPSGVGLGVLTGPAELALATVALLGFANMTNFMDGMDLMSVVGIGVPIAALSLIMIGDGQAGMEVLLCLFLAAGLAGFAPFNFPRARLYLGDSGSLAIGLAAGVLALNGVKVDFEAAFLPFGYYLTDTTTTVLLRAKAGENLFQAHARHAYQAAVKAGRSPRWVAGHVLIVNLALAGLGAVAAFVDSLRVDLAMVACGVAIAFALVWRFRTAGAPASAAR
jgi:UDP-N-acetylmuramyl pentapeptide phosphotransferase/UDP-N-acetylglucosamine-1-phosphate transferase